MLLRTFSGRTLLAVALALAAATLAPRADAQQTQSGPAGDDDVSGARKHFERALELYRSGRYAEALPELEAAAQLDPRGKDLFFNLALVHEKLGQLPEAIQALEQFRELESDPQERERARLTIERLRGAEQAAAPASTPPAPCPEVVKVTETPAKSVAGPSPVLIGAASVAVVSALVGTVFGIKALTEDVSDASTSPSLSATGLRERARRTSRDALVADVAFSLALASSATFVGVWLWAPADARSRTAMLTLKGNF